MDRTIELHIERLVIDASLIARGDRSRLERAVIRELQRLCGECATPHMSVALASLPGVSMKIAPGARVDALGSSLASTLHESLRTAIAPGDAAAQRSPR